VKELGAGSRPEGIGALLQAALKLIRAHYDSSLRPCQDRPEPLDPGAPRLPFLKGVASRGSGTADIGRRRMDDQRSELEDAVEDFAAAKLKPATDIKHREWREVLRDVQSRPRGVGWHLQQ